MGELHPAERKQEPDVRAELVQLAVPVNEPQRILKLAGLFDRYECPFELVVASAVAHDWLYTGAARRYGVGTVTGTVL